MAGLYLHIPFCEHKCLYCDFYSVVSSGTGGAGESATDRFVRSLEAEIRLRAQEERFRVPFVTVFFGGGTPSLLSPMQLERILTRLHAAFRIDPEAEITLEANPGTIDAEKLRAYRQLGVNRLSIGIQSFKDEELRFLTRIHTSRQAIEGVEAARSAGFGNINVDLIFGLPSQTVEAWIRNLAAAAALGPEHISCYSLIVEPGTPLQRMVEARQVVPIAQELDAAMYERTMEFLSARGFGQYEVSNFALPGFRSRHNSLYWQHSPYLGFGPSAHSFWEGDRWWNAASLTLYERRLADGELPVGSGERLTRRDLMTEEVFLGLRSGGIDVAGFRRRYAVDLFKDRGPEVSDFLRRGLLVKEGDRLRCTQHGYLLCDEISAAMLPREIP